MRTRPTAVDARSTVRVLEPASVSSQESVDDRAPAFREQHRTSRVTERRSLPASDVPFETVRLEGHGLEVMLPAVAGEPGAALATWARELERAGTFAAQSNAVQTLGRTRATLVDRDPNDHRPLIGVLIPEPKHLLNRDARSPMGVLRNIIALGGRPVLIPPCSDLLMPKDARARAAAIGALVSKLDGIAGPGGEDVHPGIYGERNRYSEHTNYARDRFEADVALAGLDADVFMLGICRSHQLWNAASGGSLVQDVRREGYSTITQDQEDVGFALEDPYVVKDEQGAIVFENRVHLAGGSRIASILEDRENILTNSLHHQSVRTPGHVFTVSGVVHDQTTGKDMIEATEAPNAITVQWHPEFSAKKSALERELLATLVRRAWIFKLAKRERAEGKRPSVESIRARARKEDTFELSASDDAWLRADLAKRL